MKPIQAHTSNIRIEPAGAPSYPVHLSNNATTLLRKLTPDKISTVALIADDRVARLHGQTVKNLISREKHSELLIFPEGEGHKTRATKASLEDSMLESGFGRDTLVVALGGGIANDIAGFVAATYLRGVPWLTIPTSLLAAADAAVGGKVGINTPAGKNLIGAFYHPIAVIIDLDLIGTLPLNEADNGLAEMVKHAVIADPRYLETLEQNSPEIRRLDSKALKSVLENSIRIKADIVAQDPTESDLRQVLNLGHTIGHAIETATDFGISHGRAVAAGLAVEAKISKKLGFLDGSEEVRIRQALLSLDLPTAPPEDLNRNKIVDSLSQDKKKRAGRLRFALPAKIGAMARDSMGYGIEVPDRIIVEALDEACR